MIFISSTKDVSVKNRGGESFVYKILKKKFLPQSMVQYIQALVQFCGSICYMSVGEPITICGLG